MILVVGSTGLLGGEICRQLVEKGYGVRALVRKNSAPEKITQLKALGCELVEGDLKEPDTLQEACKGMESVISTASSTLSRQEGDTIETVDHQGQLNLVDAAEEAGVKKFVFISFPDEPEFQNSLNLAKRAVEKRLRESKMDYTTLQANYFMEVWLSPALGFDFFNQKARIYGDGKNKTNWISFTDVAKFAVAALEKPSVKNRVLKLGGPEALSPLEVIRLFEAELRKEFEVEKVPVEALQAQREQADNPLDEAFTCLMLNYAKGWPMEVEEIMNEFRMPLTSVKDYIKMVLTPQV